MQSLNMWASFRNSCVGFADALVIFKGTHPGRSSYKQTNLVQDICDLLYEAHDAVEDVKFLAKPVSHMPMVELKK